MRSDWGSVKQLKKNVWRIRYWADSEKGYRRQSKTVHGTRRDANDALAALRLDHSKDAPTPTMSDCWKRWLLPYYQKRHENGDISDQTLKQYLSIWKAHIRPRWGSYEVDTIRPISVQQWIDTKPPHAASVALNICKKAVNFAQRYEFCDKNVFAIDYIMPSSVTIQRKSDGMWALEQLLCILDVIHEQYSWLLPSFILCAFGSCRVGESWAVKKSDIELVKVDGIDFAKVSINKQCLQNDKITETLKNKQSIRTVIVPDGLARYLASIDREWLMSDSNTGKLISRHVLAFPKHYNVWNKALEGLSYDYAPYNRLRASWRTFMQDELHMETDMLEKMMGHKGVGVTNAHYYNPQADVILQEYAKNYIPKRFAKLENWK